MEEPNHAAKLTPISRVKDPQGLGGILFIEGFSMCGVEFHLHQLLKQQPWPSTSKFLFKFSYDKPEELAALLEQNHFKMIVWANVIYDWAKQYKDKEKPFARHKLACERINTALKSAVTWGATLVLFCAQKASSIYKDLFSRTWTEDEYVRTDTFKSSVASNILPAEAPQRINAKSIHLANVPAEEAWYTTTQASQNNSLLPRPGLGPGLTSIAAATVGTGRLVFVGDVNAEAESCSVIQHLAVSLFEPREQLACTWCAGPAPSSTSLAACGRCQQAWYCNQECQAAHWAEHKSVCKQMAAAAAPSGGVD